MSSKTFLIQYTNGKEGRVTVPAGCRTTFGPWSPPRKDGTFRAEQSLAGTLRIYSPGSKSTEDILAVFTEVRGFREMTSVSYAEKVTTEEVSTIWKSDAGGYSREESASFGEEWAEDPPKQITRTLRKPRRKPPVKKESTRPA